MDARTHRQVVPRTARYETLGVTDDGLDDVWFLLHGYGQLASEFLKRARALAHPRRLLVAPEGLSRFYHEDHQTIGASWMTREDRESEMSDYIRYLDLLHDQLFALIPREKVRLVVLGFSQGVATASRWAMRGGGRVERLILWGAALPPEIDDPSSAEPLGGLELALVSGSRDELFSKRAREQQRTRLERIGVAFRELSFDGGHRLDDATLRALARPT